MNSNPGNTAMVIIGNYQLQTDKPPLDDFGRVRFAGRSGDQGSYVVKFRLASARSAAEGLREEARLLGLLSGNPGWARVIEEGAIPFVEEYDDGVAYYVTRCHPYTATSLLDSGSNIDPAVIERLANSCIKALADFYRVTGRAHGKLDESRILLSSMSAGEVVLTGPSPLPQIDVEGERVKDRQSLAQLMYRLVTGGGAQAEALFSWPLKRNRLWERMGPNAESLLGICNDLLRPRGQAAKSPGFQLVDKPGEAAPLPQPPPQAPPPPTPVIVIEPPEEDVSPPADRPLEIERPEPVKPQKPKAEPERPDLPAREDLPRKVRESTPPPPPPVAGKKPWGLIAGVAVVVVGVVVYLVWHPDGGNIEHYNPAKVWANAKDSYEKAQNALLAAAKEAKWVNPNTIDTVDSDFRNKNSWPHLPDDLTQAADAEARERAEKQAADFLTTYSKDIFAALGDPANYANAAKDPQTCNVLGKMVSLIEPANPAKLDDPAVKRLTTEIAEMSQAAPLLEKAEDQSNLTMVPPPDFFDAGKATAAWNEQCAQAIAGLDTSGLENIQTSQIYHALDIPNQVKAAWDAWMNWSPPAPMPAQDQRLTQYLNQVSQARIDLRVNLANDLKFPPTAPADRATLKNAFAKLGPNKIGNPDDVTWCGDVCAKYYRLIQAPQPEYEADIELLKSWPDRLGGIAPANRIAAIVADIKGALGSLNPVDKDTDGKIKQMVDIRKLLNPNDPEYLQTKSFWDVVDYDTKLQDVKNNPPNLKQLIALVQQMQQSNPVMQAELAKLNQVNGQIKAAAAVTPLPAGPAGVPLPNIAITGDPNDGKSDPLIYQIVAGNDRFTLVFKKVGDAYLCTTEMPVGLVADLVQNNAQFIADMNAGTAIPNNPISAWNAASQIPPNQIPPITCPNPNDDWLDGIALALRQKLQKAGIMGVPSRFSPMQWITPAASQDVAGRVGCRLPTESEWRAAAAAFDLDRKQDDLDRKQDNRRGANFAALAYIANAANFNPFKKIDPEIHYDQVWFRDVPNGAMTFTDFRGNVSNWVVTGDGSYGRIGESTMVDDPLPAKDFDFKAPFTKNDRFADVGFRLAFDPAQPKTDTNSLIQNLPFLDFPN